MWAPVGQSWATPPTVINYRVGDGLQNGMGGEGLAIQGLGLPKQKGGGGEARHLFSHIIYMYLHV